jgi:hypothetical protein
MNRRLVMSIGPFALLVIASCGSKGSNSNPIGDDATAPGDGSSSGSSPGDDTTTGGDGSTSSSSGGGGEPDGSSSSGGGDASGGGEAGTTASSVDVPQMHKHINRDGFFVDHAFTETALMGATLHIDATFDGTLAATAAPAKLPAYTFGSPIYVSDGVNHKGTFYLAAENNNVYALDEATGMPAIPAKSAGTPATAAGPTAGCNGNIAIGGAPLGITGTPAIDQATRLIVFSAVTADGSGNIKTHTLHAWSIDDFSEKWNLDISTISDPTVGAFSPQPQNQRSAILIVGGIAYVSFGGHYGDCGPYHGWVVGVPLNATTATAKSLSKYYVTPAREAGMWAPGGPSSDGTDIYHATGNSPDTDTPAMMANWKGAYSVLRLAAGPVFTPGAANFWHAISDDSLSDADLGGSGPLVVDNPSMTPPHLIVQLGKDGYAYTLDRTNLGGELSPKGNMHVMNGEISNVAAWATTPSDGTFVAMVSNGGSGGAGCQKGSGNLVVVNLSATAQISVPWCVNAQGNGSPSITSSDGTHDLLVWTLGAESSQQLHAWDLLTGTPVVVGSDTTNATRHFTTPIFVNGRVFVAADSRLFAFKP